MQVLLTSEEILNVFFKCFCDGGLELLGYAGIKLDYEESDYKAARKALEHPSQEEVYCQMLKENRRLAFVDTENDNEPVELTLTIATENLKKPEIAEDVVLLAGDGDYDALPCYRVLQFALYGEVVYG